MSSEITLIAESGRTIGSRSSGRLRWNGFHRVAACLPATGMIDQPLRA